LEKRVRSVRTDAVLSRLLDRVLYHAERFGRTLPEIRFFVLDRLEFASLLEKDVYPTSPINVWEGKRMVHKKHAIETGLESSLYYEVVQTGNPSYAYLNNTNNAVTQASVMAHVVGHCEFSERNVLHDSSPNRSEYVMYLVKKAERARMTMGERDYLDYWNAVESASTLIAPNSQFNLAHSTESETSIGPDHQPASRGRDGDEPAALVPVFDTLTRLLSGRSDDSAFERELRNKRKRETLSRKGYVLKAPCQDVLDFLRHYAPMSGAERAIMDYKYVTKAPQDFVIRTQIMNEGWAMYWEKKIMLALFEERAVDGIIDYARVFSNVCSPRPYFQRNPYHLGYNLWCHIEQLYRDGKVSLDYHEEVDQEKKDTWRKQTTQDPIAAMGHLVETVTDYEFLRRYLTTKLIHELHLNRLDRRTAERMGVKDADIVHRNDAWVWLHPGPIREEMLRFYTHFYRPRLYVIDADFQDGGLLLFHRDDGRSLRKDWIRPTLRNLNLIWKAPVALLSKDQLYAVSGNQYKSEEVRPVSFQQVVGRMRKGERPFRAS
jgi:stage V sporulation protein R